MTTSLSEHKRQPTRRSPAADPICGGANGYSLRLAERPRRKRDGVSLTAGAWPGIRVYVTSALPEQHVHGYRSWSDHTSETTRPRRRASVVMIPRQLGHRSGDEVWSSKWQVVIAVDCPVLDAGAPRAQALRQRIGS